MATGSRASSTSSASTPARAQVSRSDNGDFVDGDTPLRRRPDIVYRELAGDEGGVLLAVDSGAYHGVNPTGLMIWELIDGERGTDEIVAALRTRLEDAPADIEQDVVAFLAALHERRLVD